MRRALAFVLALAWAPLVRADPEQPADPTVLERLPQPVQDAVAQTLEQMEESRDPPDRFLFSLLGLPRTRFGSGTAWQPDDSPLYAAAPLTGQWGFLLQGTLFTGYNWQSSERGWHRFMGRNTLMGAVFRHFKRSELSARLAISLEPLTIGRRGYPLILQTGQTRDGARLHDRQYALDFFRELAATYGIELTPRWALFVYAAFSGEPALGPVYFTQRVSAVADPLAPIGLLWQENSHSSYGVLTLGAFSRTLKLEASWFNGEVPRAKPYTIAIRRPDSVSFRVSWNPTMALSLQLSYGFLNRPVESEPERSVHRLSASVSYARGFRTDPGLAGTLSVAERATKNGERGAALLAEGYWNIDGHHTVYGRAEVVQKSGVELVLSNPTPELYAVGSLAAGYVYYFGPFISLSPGLGLRASVNPMAQELAREYGTRVAFGFVVYAQLRTAALPMERKCRGKAC